ncbi:MAG: dihydropteroate synthase [Pseudomonadota bacterium]
MSANRYFRPIPASGALSDVALIAGGLIKFDSVEVLCRGQAPQILPADAAIALWPEAANVLARVTTPRSAFAGLSLDGPLVMGIVNVTPDSFSDGGKLEGSGGAVDHALQLVERGADILDVGGESTRPGATPVSEMEEIDRVLPVIKGLIAAGCQTPISIDTRNAVVAKAALAAGAVVLNDVSALTHDSDSITAAQDADGVCLMHALGDPRTMQDNPTYADVLLDVYDYLADRIDVAIAQGVRREKILIDPGIGFGKTIKHNLALIRGLSLFHGLGCGILLGVSRKGFIGKLGQEPRADERLGGSLATGLAGLDQGAQILRVHDVGQTAQAVRLWRALRGAE